MDDNCILDPVMDLILLLAITKLREIVPSFEGFKYIIKQNYATEVYKSNCKNMHGRTLAKIYAFDSVRI